MNIKEKIMNLFLEHIEKYNNIQKHKVFISFHHQNDEKYKIKLEKLAQENNTEFISKAIQDGDINENLETDRIYQIIRDDYIADSTVTIVLIGKDTWKRKYVDWEIASSLRDTRNNPRNGLVGILLPTYNNISYNFEHLNFTTDKEKYFCKNTIPPRLWDNFNHNNQNERYAEIYSWNYAITHLKEIIDEAFKKRKKTNNLNQKG